MGWLDKIRGEFVDVIEWTDDSNDTLVYRFERHNNEIKYGAKLTVREGQAVVFISEGRIADVFEPGMYTLQTQNLPVLSTLKGWKHGFESPFKAEAYFVSTRRFTDQKWGTKNPIMLRDAEFGPVRLRAFGTYAVRVTDPATFIREVVGTDGHFTTDEITHQLRNITVSRFTDALGEAKVPVLDLAANYDELGVLIRGKIQPEFGNYGLELTKLLVENISLPEAVEEALDKRSSMGIVGNLNQYTQFQTAEAIRDAASNPGGLGAAGVGVGAGFAMGGQMAQSFASGAQQQAPAAGGVSVPPPIPGAGDVFYVAKDGQQTGPFSVQTLRQQCQAGQFITDSMVWKQGMAEWARAGDVAALAGLFNAPPPPPPAASTTPPPPPPSAPPSSES